MITTINPPPVPKMKKPEDNLSAVTSDYIAPMMYRNRLVLAKVSHPKESKSLKKKKAIDRFKIANIYAKNAMQVPGLKEIYARGIDEKKSNAHTVAVVDYLNAPVIHTVNTKEYHGAIGDKLRIKATDDFEVTSVEVTILNSSGKRLEKGKAEKYRRKPSTWVYTTVATNPQLPGTRIQVTAKDRPENMTWSEVVIGE